MSSKPDPLSDYPLAKASVYTNEPEKNIEQKYKTFIAPRDSMYIPKPQMFNRYNYENYNGYQYKNPFRPPQKYPIEDKVLQSMGSSTKLKNNPSHGASKNL